MHSLPTSLQHLRQNLQTKGSKKAAWKVIDSYFHAMGIETIKEELWILTKAALTNDLAEQLEKGMDRHNLIFGYEFLLLFLDAVKLLHEKWEIEQNQP